MSFVLHAHPLSSYCWKVLIALYEKGRPFDFRPVDFGDQASAAAFRALWPIGKMPVLEDDGRIIVESSVIIEYLDLEDPEAAPLVPRDPHAALEVRRLDRIFDNYVMAPMQKIVFDRIRPADQRNPADVADGRRLIETSYGWLEQEIGGRPWAAGASFSLADCAAAPSLFYAEKVQPTGGRFPALAAYLARLEARPSFARVLEEAKPWFRYFPAEA
ncbi:MAG TPA: glutathione S-transferase family protein [Allosphingosinicella sp.]